MGFWSKLFGTAQPSTGGQRPSVKRPQKTTPCPSCGHQINISLNQTSLDGVLDSAQQAFLGTIGTGNNPHVQCPKCGATFIQFGN